MIPQIESKINDEAAMRALDRVARVSLGAPMLMRELAGIMHDEVEENFAQQGRPRWKALKPETLQAKYNKEMFTRKGNLRRNGLVRFNNAVRQNKILQGRGRLAASITPDSGPLYARVGTNVVYAAIQNFGGKTKAHRIVARRKRALAFGGIVRRSVNHPGSDIPARPFMVLGPNGGERIATATERYLRSLIP